MPSLSVCRCLFRLMRRCFLGSWICLPVSERFRLMWKCHLFDYSTYIQFCVHWHGGKCLRWLVPNYAVVFWLGCVYSPVTLCQIQLFLIYFNMWTKLKMKKRSWDFITGCGYTIESFGGLQKKDIAFLFIALLSVMIDNTWMSISSKPIIIRLIMSNKFSALRHFVGITYTNNILILGEYTAKHKKQKHLMQLHCYCQISQQYYQPYNQYKVLSEAHHFCSTNLNLSLIYVRKFLSCCSIKGFKYTD